MNQENYPELKGDLMHMLINESVDWICFFDASNQYVYASKASEQITGYSVQESLQIPDFMLHIAHPNDKERVSSILGKNNPEFKKKIKCEFRIITRYNIEKTIEHNRAPLYSPEGDFLGCRAANRDITDLIHTNQKLQEQKILLDLFFDHATEGFFFMMLDEPIMWQHATNKQALVEYAFDHQRITKVNKAMLNQYALHEADLLGATPRDFFTHDIRHGKELWFRMFETGRLDVESNERKADGSPLIIEGTYLCFYDAGGRITGHFGVQRDITEKTRSEEMLRHTEELWRSALDGARHGVWDWNIETNEVKYSTTWMQMLGYSENELPENVETWRSLVHPEDLPKAITEIEKNISGQSHFYHVEHRLKCADGSYKWILSQGKLYKLGKMGGPRRFIGTHVDISDMKEIEQRLNELIATKDKFFSIIAHDLKNPFHQLLGFTELMTEYARPHSDARLNKYINYAHQSAQRGYTLLQNLLEWSRSQQGIMRFKPRVFFVNELAGNSINLMITAAREKGIIIINQIPTALKAYADSNMIDTVFRNLLSNALKFSFKGGKIYIHATSTDNVLQISIRDEGVGISTENLPKLFRIDVNISSSGTQNEIGSGLGLILCHELLQRNSGTISAISKLGEGTTFMFTLPAAK